MSSGLSSRLKQHKKQELARSPSQAQILFNKLCEDNTIKTVEKVLQNIDQVSALLLSNNADKSSHSDRILHLSQNLKIYGVYLEILYKEQLDHAFKIFRDKAQDDANIDLLARVRLLELIELRAIGWKDTNGMNVYYRLKQNQYGNAQVDMTESISSLSESATSTSPPVLAPGEVLKPSGKFPKPTRISGKKYCKDEVVIRNADSGKVMGIKGRRVHMIEELSETIISFQRVNPGAKERLVQITGANEESINHAKQLIEDTIRRNASPVRDPLATPGGPLTNSSSSINSSTSDDSTLPPLARASRALLHSLSTNDANIGEYKYTVVVNGHAIKITGDNLDLVRTSKLVLEEYFSGEPINDVTQFFSFDSLPQSLPEDIISPLSPPESLPSPEFINGENNDRNDKTHLRKSRVSVDEKKRNSNEDKEKSLYLNYSIEILAHLAMSPLCLGQPKDWERICQDYPYLIKNVVEKFDATNYLSARITEPSGVVSADDLDPNEV